MRDPYERLKDRGGTKEETIVPRCNTFPYAPHFLAYCLEAILQHHPPIDREQENPWQDLGHPPHRRGGATNEIRRNL